MCSRYSCHEVSGYFYLLKQSCYAMSWLSDLSLNSVRSEYFILPVQIIMRKEAWNCILSEIPFVTLKLMLEHQTNWPWIVMMLGALPACQTHLLTPVIHQDRHKLIHQQLFIHISLYTLLYLFTYIFIYCLFNIIHQSNAWKRKYFLNRVFWEVEKKSFYNRRSLGKLILGTGLLHFISQYIFVTLYLVCIQFLLWLYGSVFVTECKYLYTFHTVHKHQWEHHVFGLISFALLLTIIWR